jgi:hypothetical protein
MVVVDMAEAVVAEGEAEASMVEVDILVAIVAGTPEDSMVDTLAVVIEVGTLEDSAAGILAVDTVLLLYLEDTLAGIMLLLYLEDTLVDAEVGTLAVM